MAKHYVSSIERSQKKKFKMRKRTKTFVIAFAVLLIISGLIYAASKITITGGVITGFSIDGENSVPEIPGAKLMTGSLYKGLVFDMPLKIRYTKEETAGSEIMTDRTPYSNDGQNYGAIVGADYTTFDGEDDYIIVPDDDSLDITDEITIAAWLYPKEGVLKYPLFKISTFEISWGDSAYDGTQWGGSIWSPIGGRIRVNSIINYIHNQWYHVVITAKKNDYLRLFINGDNVRIVNFDYDVIKTSSYSLIIGDYQYGGYAFNGSISDVRIYNRALSGSEIKLLFDKGRR